MLGTWTWSNRNLVLGGRCPVPKPVVLILSGCLGGQPAPGSEVHKKMFCLHWGTGQSLSLMDPEYNPCTVERWIPLVVKLVVMGQTASPGSFGPGRRPYLGFEEPERAVGVTPPFDTHGNFKSRKQSNSQPHVLVPSPIASPFDKFSSLLLWSISKSCVMRPWPFFFFGSSLSGFKSHSRELSLLKTLLWVKSGFWC